jgi:hypothetical protein
MGGSDGAVMLRSRGKVTKLCLVGSDRPVLGSLFLEGHHVLERARGFYIFGRLTLRIRPMAPLKGRVSCAHFIRFTGVNTLACKITTTFLVCE